MLKQRLHGEIFQVILSNLCFGTKPKAEMYLHTVIVLNNKGLKMGNT